jgi:hypothetical protein
MNFTTLMNKNYEELVFNLIFPRKPQHLCYALGSGCVNPLFGLAPFGIGFGQAGLRSVYVNLLWCGLDSRYFGFR